jgi:DNA-binding SARP family transcriptional activator
MVEQLDLALLGTVEIRQGGIPLAGFRSRKVLALLCYLAVTARPHLRPTLAGLLWGELPEANARSNLRKALANLRQLVAPHLRITRHEVTFDRECPYWLDVESFEQVASTGTDIAQLQDAVELYRGDFLEGLYVRRARAFEEWVLARRARLRELALDALHTLAVHHTRRGTPGHAAGVDYATRLLALEPWREEAHRQLMLLLAYSGQRSAALAQYQTCRRVLAEDLGVKPGAETTTLYERIRDGILSKETKEYELQMDRAAVPATPPPFLSALPPVSRAHTPFVARERELDQLDEYLKGALAGHGRVIFVTGEAGTGKTVLVQEFARRAQAEHADLVAATGNCNAYTGVGDPYLPFREILGLLTGDVASRWAAGALDTDGVRRLWATIPYTVGTLVKTSPGLIGTFLAAPALLDRARAAAPGGAPWLDRLEERLASVEPDRANLKQTDLFEQYAALLMALARQHPLLLAVDDLQWADAGSIHLLFHLGRRLAGSRILVAGSYRPAEVALGREGPSTSSGQRERHPLQPVIHEFQRQFGPIEVALGPTGDQRFVEAFLDSEPNRLDVAFRQALYARTQGHALYTVEMLRGMRERGDLVRDESGRWVEGSAVDWASLPARVEGVIGERIDRLPAALRQTLQVASVEGETFTAEVVAQVQAVAEREIIRQLSAELDRVHHLVVSAGSQQPGPGGQRTSRYRFRHILFQEYVYRGLDKVERAYMHQAVGDALER